MATNQVPVSSLFNKTKKDLNTADEMFKQPSDKRTIIKPFYWFRKHTEYLTLDIHLISMNAKGVLV